MGVGNAEATVCNCLFMSLLYGHIQKQWDSHIDTAEQSVFPSAIKQLAALHSFAGKWDPCEKVLHIVNDNIKH